MGLTKIIQRAGAGGVISGLSYAIERPGVIGPEVPVVIDDHARANLDRLLTSGNAIPHDGRCPLFGACCADSITLPALKAARPRHFPGLRVRCCRRSAIQRAGDDSLVTHGSAFDLFRSRGTFPADHAAGAIPLLASTRYRPTGTRRYGRP